MERINESRKEWILELFSEVEDHLKRVSNYKLWQDGNHPEILTTARFTRQKLEYIHDNPVADEIVDEPEEYLDSSARDYYSKKKGLFGSGYYRVAMKIEWAHVSNARQPKEIGQAA